MPDTRPAIDVTLGRRSGHANSLDKAMTPQPIDTVPPCLTISS